MSYHINEESLIDAACQHVVAIHWIDFPYVTPAELRSDDMSAWCASGFIVEVHDEWHLVSAGHVALGLKGRLKAMDGRAKIGVLDASQVDRSRSPIEVNIIADDVISQDDEHADLLLVKLNPCQRGAFERRRLKPMKLRLGQVPPVYPERYVLGFPTCLDVTAIRLKGTQAHVSVGTDIVMPPLSPCDGDFSSDIVESIGRVFRAQLPSQVFVTRTNGERQELTGLDGFSGGPILAPCGSGGGKSEFFLRAIQSKWLPTFRTLCAPSLRVLNERLGVAPGAVFCGEF
jgi:hypothetical protein